MENDKELDADGNPIVKDENTENKLDAEGNPIVDDNNKLEDEKDGFDPNKFLDDIPIKKEDTEENKLDEEGNTIEDEKKDEDELIWNDFEEEEVVDEENQEKLDEHGKPIVDEDISNVDNNEKETEVTTEAFNQVATEIGLDTEKFKSISDFKEHLEALEAENESLRNNNISGQTNKKITTLTDLKNKDDEELVRLSLEKEGFEGEDLEEAVDKYIDNDMLKIEAKKIRFTIDKAIETEKRNITQSNSETDAKQQKEHEESVRLLGEHIAKTETMFGYPMAKDKESLVKVQQGHLKYISSGKFMADVFKDDASLSETAWFVRNKDVILKAVANSNLQKGKSAILNDIEEPEVNNVQRFKSPNNDHEFDPKAFTYGK